MLTVDQWSAAEKFRKAVGMRDDPWHRDHGDTAIILPFKTEEERSEEQARARVLKRAHELDW